MIKCTICKEEIQELFLDKLKGTIVRKPGSRKQYAVCAGCQKKYRGKEEMLELIN